MIIIRSNVLVKVLSFGFAKGITLYPFILINSDCDQYDINHERIHIEQQKEMLIIFFYIQYLAEWMFKGYRNISFEIEAYTNECNLNYLDTRKNYDFTKWL